MEPEINEMVIVTILPSNYMDLLKKRLETYLQNKKYGMDVTVLGSV